MEVKYISGLRKESIESFSNRGIHGAAWQYAYEVSNIMIENLIQTKDGTWKLDAKCHGSRKYLYMMSIQGWRGLVKSCLCSCPDLRGKLCKHACAVLLLVIDPVLSAAVSVEKSFLNVDSKSVYSVMKQYINPINNQNENPILVEVCLSKENAESKAKLVSQQLSALNTNKNTTEDNNSSATEDASKSSTQNASNERVPDWKTRTLYQWSSTDASTAADKPAESEQMQMKDGANCEESHEQKGYWKVWVEQQLVVSPKREE
mmetsp:Transcript_12133/g.21936  ORF Transcript_12133/g.21936 Transcript_12133/m.21936 type:complete len:261 (-) Transcript_12133:892-1674(-)